MKDYHRVVFVIGSYEVIFYDGFKKLVQPINIRPMPNEYKVWCIEKKHNLFIILITVLDTSIYYMDC